MFIYLHKYNYTAVYEVTGLRAFNVTPCVSSECNLIQLNLPDTFVIEVTCSCYHGIPFPLYLQGTFKKICVQSYLKVVTVFLWLYMYAVLPE